jgi:hypothetical protein
MACSECEVIAVTRSDVVNLPYLTVFVNANSNVVEWIHINLRQTDIDTGITTLTFDDRL